MELGMKDNATLRMLLQRNFDRILHLSIYLMSTHWIGAVFWPRSMDKVGVCYEKATILVLQGKLV